MIYFHSASTVLLGSSLFLLSGCNMTDNNDNKNPKTAPHEEVKVQANVPQNVAPTVVSKVDKKTIVLIGPLNKKFI